MYTYFSLIVSVPPNIAYIYILYIYWVSFLSETKTLRIYAPHQHTRTHTHDSHAGLQAEKRKAEKAATPKGKAAAKKAKAKPAPAPAAPAGPAEEWPEEWPEDDQVDEIDGEPLGVGERWADMV